MTTPELLMLFAVVLALVGDGIYLGMIHDRLKEISELLKGDKHGRV